MCNCRLRFDANSVKSSNAWDCGDGWYAGLRHWDTCGCQQSCHCIVLYWVWLCLGFLYSDSFTLHFEVELRTLMNVLLYMWLWCCAFCNSFMWIRFSCVCLRVLLCEPENNPAGWWIPPQQLVCQHWARWCIVVLCKHGKAGHAILIRSSIFHFAWLICSHKPINNQMAHKRLQNQKKFQPLFFTLCNKILPTISWKIVHGLVMPNTHRIKTTQLIGPLLELGRSLF